MDKGLEKLNESKPTVCDSCGGKVIYKGTGEYECEKCKKLLLDDYGRVRRYIDANGSSIMILARETGVSKEVLEYLVKEGVLTVQEEADGGRKCAKCGVPVDSGRFCRKCAMELVNGLAGTFEDGDSTKTEKKKSAVAKMHRTRRYRE